MLRFECGAAAGSSLQPAPGRGPPSGQAAARMPQLAEGSQGGGREAPCTPLPSPHNRPAGPSARRRTALERSSPRAATHAPSILVASTPLTTSPVSRTRSSVCAAVAARSRPMYRTSAPCGKGGGVRGRGREGEGRAGEACGSRQAAHGRSGAVRPAGARQGGQCSMAVSGSGARTANRCGSHERPPCWRLAVAPMPRRRSGRGSQEPPTTAKLTAPTHPHPCPTDLRGDERHRGGHPRQAGPPAQAQPHQAEHDD